MVSLIGCVSLIAAAVILCIYSNLYYEKKSETYREIISFLYMAKQKMSCSSVMISTILDTACEYQILDSCGFFLLAKDHGVERAFYMTSGKLPLEANDKKRIGEFFGGFGESMLSAEIENISLCIDDLEQSYASLRSKLPDKKKVSSTMIICVTLLLIILIV